MTEPDGDPRPVGASGTGCYPGSFNPPTVAHLAMAETAIRQAGLLRVDLVVSRVALGKEDLEVPSLADRVHVLQQVARNRPWLGVVVTEHRLVADIARGYDAVIMGADKWRQVLDPRWYAADPDAERGPAAAAAAARDALVAGLPRVLVAPRQGDRPDGVEILEIEDHHTRVSATAVRAGEPRADGWMLSEARAFDRATGAWSDPERYRASAAGGS